MKRLILLSLMASSTMICLGQETQNEAISTMQALLSHKLTIRAAINNCKSHFMQLKNDDIVKMLETLLLPETMDSMKKSKGEKTAQALKEFAIDAQKKIANNPDTNYGEIIFGSITTLFTSPEFKQSIQQVPVN